MTDIGDFLSGPDNQRIAFRRVQGEGPTVVWLGGFHSDMTGTKAQVLADRAQAGGWAYLRFDYFGHGASDGAFEAGTISRWREDALAVIDQLTDGPLVLVGSSMGGWLALLLARELGRRGETDRLQGVVLIAPAVDMTEELMLKGFSSRQLKALKETGRVDRPSQYSAEPYPVTNGLIEDGRRHLLFGRGIDVGAPVTILQGGRDKDVPREHAMRLVQHLLVDPVTITLVPDGDHRLSRPEDLDLLKASVTRALEVPPEQLALEI